MPHPDTDAAPWTHTPLGPPTGVAVLTTGDCVTGVTYAGVPLPEQQDWDAADAAAADAAPVRVDPEAT